MTNLLSLELKRHRLRSYHLATILSGVSLLGFQYFMAAIPYIDPTDAESASSVVRKKSVKGSLRMKS